MSRALLLEVAAAAALPRYAFIRSGRAIRPGERGYLARVDPDGTVATLRPSDASWRTDHHLTPKQLGHVRRSSDPLTPSLSPWAGPGRLWLRWQRVGGGRRLRLLGTVTPRATPTWWVERGGLRLDAVSRLAVAGASWQRCGHLQADGRWRAEGPLAALGREVAALCGPGMPRGPRVELLDGHRREARLDEVQRQASEAGASWVDHRAYGWPAASVGGSLAMSGDPAWLLGAWWVQ